MKKIFLLSLMFEAAFSATTNDNVNGSMVDSNDKGSQENTQENTQENVIIEERYKDLLFENPRVNPSLRETLRNKGLVELLGKLVSHLQRNLNEIVSIEIELHKIENAEEFDEKLVEELVSRHNNLHKKRNNMIMVFETYMCSLKYDDLTSKAVFDIVKNASSNRGLNLYLQELCNRGVSLASVGKKDADSDFNIFEEINKLPYEMDAKLKRQLFDRLLTDCYRAFGHDLLEASELADETSVFFLGPIKNNRNDIK